MIKPVASFEEFTKLDLRIGKIVDITDIPGSEKLYRVTVDLGSDYGKRMVFAGVKPWYRKEDLSGKHFIFVANLAPRKIMGSESQGMMLAASNAANASDGGRPILIPVEKTVEAGTALR